MSLKPLAFSEVSKMQLIQSQNLTMSSREIAGLTGKRHPDVKRDILAMLDSLNVDVSSFARIYHDSQNREQTEYLLDREHTDCLLTGYSVKMRMVVIKRWHELEAKQAAPAFSVPSTLSGALRLAAEQAEQIEQQQVLIKQQQPAVEFVGKYVQSEGLKGFREVAKLLGAKEHAFREFLTENRIMYMLGGEWTAYAQHLDAGRFEVKTSTTASGRAVCSSKFTTKGVNWIAGLWAVETIKQQPLHATR
jgi:phage antirepressor YoqD-like protein